MIFTFFSKILCKKGEKAKVEKLRRSIFRFYYFLLSCRQGNNLVLVKLVLVDNGEWGIAFYCP